MESSGDKYACKMCRRVLFTSDDLMEHEPQRHEISTRRKLKDVKQKGNSIAAFHNDDCSSFFLADTKDWMDENHLAEGKLLCPSVKCQSRLGQFQWAGSQCSCGTWVTPSIKITKSRVDKVYSAAAVPIVQSSFIVQQQQDQVYGQDQDQEQQQQVGETLPTEAKQAAATAALMDAALEP